MQHTLNKICIVKNTPLKMTFVLFIYIYTHMYKINTLFSISNYLLAINRTQQLSQIEAKKKKKAPWNRAASNAWRDRSTEREK